MDAETLRRNFTYHPPLPGQPQRYASIRSKTLELAELLNAECPDSREKSVALTHLETTTFWANAAIARNETATDENTSDANIEAKEPAV